MIAAPMSEPTFYYDFNSPYAYLAAHRVDDVLPVRARWQPIAFGALIRQIGKVPWSLQAGPERERRLRECEQRTAALRLPLSWPDGWPDRNYSILVLRAALIAADHDRLREFSLAPSAAGWAKAATCATSTRSSRVRAMPGSTPRPSRRASRGLKSSSACATRPTRRSPAASPACRPSPSATSCSGATTASRTPRPR